MHHSVMIKNVFSLQLENMNTMPRAIISNLRSINKNQDRIFSVLPSGFML